MPKLWQRLLARPASESGTLCHGDGTHGRSDRCRRAFMLPILVAIEAAPVRQVNRLRAPSRTSRLTPRMIPPSLWNAT